MLEGDEFFHFTGVRFDDDRAIKGAVAVRSDNQVPGYNFEYDIVPYQTQIPLGDTKRFSLRPHEIIMRGINTTTGRNLTVVAYWKENVSLGQFQMNLRRESSGLYLNHDAPMVTPGSQSSVTNRYIQEAGAGDFRLDLRVHPSIPNEGAMYITVFGRDITGDPKPDLLIRDLDFTLSLGGQLALDVAVLNQGFIRANNARAPVFVDGALVASPLVSVDPGDTKVFHVSHNIRVSCGT
jgi:hypothetical protein